LHFSRFPLAPAKKKGKKMSTKTNTVKITKATIAEQLDSVAVSVAKSDEKATQTKTEKLLSLIGGEKKFESSTDAEKRKVLDLCISAINERISELKAENKAIDKEHRKPLKDSLVWQGLRSLLGLASAMRSRLRTEAEKTAAKAEAAEKARRENIAKDDVQNVKSATSLEEGVLCLIEMARKCKVSLASLQNMIERRF
jgi:hypothetical protein